MALRSCDLASCLSADHVPVVPVGACCCRLATPAPYATCEQHHGAYYGAVACAGAGRSSLCLSRNRDAGAVSTFAAFGQRLTTVLQGIEAVNQPVCIVTGVGDATGSAIVRRFAAGGYRVAMIARNAGRLARLRDEIEETYAYPCDVGDLDALERTIAAIQLDVGAVRSVVHNAVAHTFGTFLESNPAELERNFRVNTTALLYLVRQVAPEMIKAKQGSIIVTGNTASHRGVPNYALFAPTKAAQRILCESMSRDLGPKRIHVGYVTIDAPIDVTWLGESDGERPKWLVPPEDWPWSREDFFAKPSAIADEVYHVAHQHHSAWAFETTIRPFAEKW